MKAELKNIKSYSGHEGVAFNAFLYVDGVKTAFVINQGDGGPLFFEKHGKHCNKEKLEELEKYIKTLDDKVFGKPNSTEDAFSLKMDLDLFVYDLYETHLIAKAKAKMEKSMLTKILVGVPGTDTYSFYNYKRLLSEIPTVELQASVNRIKSQLKAGEVILNDNLEQLGILI